jgi:glycosyltransferase involved in cell wall biosynthesis
VGLYAASPVYYNVPLYRALASDPRISFQAIFSSNGGIRPYDSGYGKAFSWDVDALAGYESRFLRKAETNPIHGRFWEISDRDIVSELTRARFEVLWLFGYNYLTPNMAVAAQRLLRKPILFREEQTTLHPRPLARTLVKEVALRALFSQGAAVYISSENRRWFEHYGVPPERLFFSPYAVDNDRFRADAERLQPQRNQLRERFGVTDPDLPIILTVSRLLPKKQPLYLLEAFRKVRARHKCALVVVGTGEEEGPMRAKVAAEGIPDVHFAGFLNQTEVSEAYVSADIFTLLSLQHETFGLVTNEAMNFGLPVVLSDKVGCSSDLVIPGGNGFRVSAHDSDDAAVALAILVEDRDLRRRMGAKSRERIAPWNGTRAAQGVVQGIRYLVGERRWQAAASLSPDRESMLTKPSWWGVV